MSNEMKDWLWDNKQERKAMTVKQLRDILNSLDDETEIQLYVETGMGLYIVNADEVTIGTEPNKLCICGEE